jgi:hypothetical protein
VPTLSISATETGYRGRGVGFMLVVVGSGRLPE